MVGPDGCPHPEKKRWPLVDEPGGPRCTCGCVWAPYVDMTVSNFLGQNKGMRLEVYRCRTGGGRLLDHWHTTDAAKKGPRPVDRVDVNVNGPVLSGPAIQKKPWRREHKPRHVGRATRDRMRRWLG